MLGVVKTMQQAIVIDGEIFMTYYQNGRGRFIYWHGDRMKVYSTQQLRKIVAKAVVDKYTML